MLYIPTEIKREWLEKLRDGKLKGRESWRLHDDHQANFLRTVNPITDQFHYSCFGLLLRTPTFRELGRFEVQELGFQEYHPFYFIGETYLHYESDGTILGQRRHPHYGVIGTTRLKKLGFRFEPGGDWQYLEFLNLGHITKRGYVTFEEFADEIELRIGKKKELVTHTNSKLQF